MSASHGIRLLAASAFAAALVALPALTAPAAAQEHEVGHWMGLYHTFDTDLPKPPGTLAGQAPGAAPKILGRKGADGQNPAAAMPPATREFAARGTPGSTPRHRPNSFQIITPGKTR